MTNDDNVHEPDTARLLSTSYHSPYTRSGAPALPASQDPYAKLRARALQTLEAMGFDPDTMVEHGVLFAEHQDPFGHVSNAQFLAFFGQTWMRVTDAYGQYLSKEELDGIYQAKTVVPMVRRFELEIKRQVKFPDSIIAAFRQERIEPWRNGGTSVLFSLKQQAIVAEIKGTTTYVSPKTGRPVDIRTLGGGFPALLEGFTKKSEKALARLAQWEKDHPKKPRPTTKI